MASRTALVALCKERGIKGYSGKTKEALSALLGEVPAPMEEKICRLNYIGSKFQLLDWITDHIKAHTGWTSFAEKTIGDLFAGTGVVSYHFRKLGANVVSNDAELYSSIITRAFTRGTYTANCERWITTLQAALDSNQHNNTVGYITQHYSPYEGNERKFFTIDNARRIDYLRKAIETAKGEITEDEYAVLLASLLLSADAVSNVPAVYGCFLKEFKAKAAKPLRFVPIHTNRTPPQPASNTWNKDVMELANIQADLVYLDPPYNERQYSKNYFPLNLIAKTPEDLATEAPLKGKTGIPTDCFLSPFCKKAETVLASFKTLFEGLQAEWVVLSYSSESTVSKESLVKLMEEFGTVTVVERDYKRFKSFEYNEDKAIQEYLFFLHTNSNATTKQS